MSIFHLFNPPHVATTTLQQRQFEWHGHRGARGLFPENTIPAMKGAIEYGINWLEIDIVVSKDRQVIVSHDPYFNPAFCSDPQGNPITKANQNQYNLFRLTAAEIRKFDCGLRQNAAYPQQQTLAAYKPTFVEMARAVDEFCKKNNYPLPNWNIEIKSEPTGYNVWTVEPDEMIDLLLNDLDRLDLRQRCQVQSFDKNPLRELRRRAPELRMAVLTYDLKGINHHLAELDFIPEVYAPFYPTIFKTTVKKAHNRGMKVIPWTVNSKWWMRRLIHLGVDGIITDYPNKIGEILAN